MVSNCAVHSSQFERHKKYNALWNSMEKVFPIFQTDYVTQSPYFCLPPGDKYRVDPENPDKDGIYITSFALPS